MRRNRSGTNRLTRLGHRAFLARMSRGVLAAQQRMDDKAFPVRVKIAVGERGLDMHTMVLWLQEQFPDGDFAHHSQHGPGQIDAALFYFRSVEAAQRFLMTFPGLAYADGTVLSGYTSLAKQSAGRVYTEEDRRGHSVPPARPTTNPTRRIDTDAQPVDFPQMCNRATPGDREKVAHLFDVKKVPIFNDGPRIVHPREPGLVVRLDEGDLVLEQMTWGFPVVLKGKQGQPLKPKAVNNARFDKLQGFWKKWALQPRHRCLIPTACYAEAVGKPGQMTTTWLSLKSAPIFAWAGLWSVSDEWGEVYTGVMTDNAPELSSIHDRSPVILAPEDWQAWLTAPLDELYQFDRPWPASDVRVHQTDVLWKEGGNTLPDIPDLII